MLMVVIGLLAGGNTTLARALAGRALRAGPSVVLDATFGSPAERQAVQRLARRTGVPLVWIVCRTD